MIQQRPAAPENQPDWRERLLDAVARELERRAMSGPASPELLRRLAARIRQRLHERRGGSA